MRRSIRLSVLCAMILATGLHEVRADGNADAKALFEKVDAQMYYPQDHGLKDLSCTMTNSMMKMSPMTAKMKIMLYWKQPDKKAVKMEGMDDSNPMMSQMAGQMKKSMGKMVELIVHTRRTDHLDRYDYTLTKDGEMTKVSGALKEGKGHEGDPESETLWIDGSNRLAKMEAESENGKATVSDIKYVDKGGKLLIESMSQAGEGGGMKGGGKGGASGSQSFEYTQVKDIWLVSKMHTTSPMMQNMKVTMEFTDYKVNEGIDDKTFEEETERGDDSAEGGGAKTGGKNDDDDSDSR